MRGSCLLSNGERGPKFVALGPVLGSFLGHNNSLSHEPLLGCCLPSEARHAGNEATRPVTANCT